MNGSDTGFVGRQHEMLDLASALDSALSGQGQIVALAGEPGIGKTRTAAEFTAIAERHGATVWWGRCYEGEGAPPYWPWIQPLRSYVQNIEADRLRLALGLGASHIAQIVPDIHNKLSDIDTPPALEPEQARFRLFDSIAAFLKNISQSQPVVLVLDDLHWADTSSLLLLEFIGSQMAHTQMLIVGTYRDVEVTRRHPLSQSLGTLVREPHFRSIELRGLAQQEVSQLAEATVGSALEGSLLSTVYSRTEGNPLFVGEIMKLLDSESAYETQEWRLRIPTGIRNVIGRRLDRLSEKCNQALIIAAVMGREFSLNQLNLLIEDMSSEHLEDVLDEALSIGVIEEIRSETGRYQFSHALIQQTLSEELSSARRVMLHARIADALEELYGANVESHAPELAHHFSEAQTVLGADKTAHYSILAGEHALAAYAWEDAVTLFERAIEAKKGLPVDEEKARLLFGLAKAQWYGYGRNDANKAFETVMPAFDYYVESGHIDKALAIAEYPFPIDFGYMNTAEELVSKAVNLPPSESIQQGYLLSRYGTVLHSQKGDAGGAQKSFEKAMDIALRNEDAALEMHALNEMTKLYEGQQRFNECLEIALRVIELSKQIDLPMYDMSPRFRAVNACAALGYLDSASQHAEVMLSAKEKYPSVSGLAATFFSNDLIARLRGDFSEAKRFNDQGLAIASRDCRLLYSRALLEYQTGNFSQGEDYLERLLDVMRSSTPGPNLEWALVPPVITLTSLITGDTGRFEMLESIIEVITTPQAVRHAYWFSHLAMGIVAVQTGDSDEASKQYAILKSYPHPMHGWGKIASRRLLGLLSKTTGDMDNSAVHFENAMTACRQGGYRPELAWTCYDYAKCLLDRNNSDDRSKALSLIDDALSISTELGMRPLAEKSSALKERIEAADSPQSALKHPKGLTEREVEVLRLAAQGKTNREIAEGLFISIRTVQNHIRNIYDKIEARNRAEATAFAINHLSASE